MASPPSSPENGDQSEFHAEDSSAKPASFSHHKMSPRNRALFFFTAWLIVLMPFLFWWNTWFGRRLPNRQITEYLQDEKHPRHIQHALIQLGERMGRHDSAVARWYPQLIRLASHPVEEIRNTDAWVMGQDSSASGFHETLLKMLQDSSPMVRGNAAFSLVRFGDASGRSQIVALLQPAGIIAPVAGRVTDTDKVGTAIHQGGLIAKLQVDSSAVASQNGEQSIELRSPISGRIRTLSIAPGTNVAAGAEVATIAPGDEQVWEALRALYLIGQPDDLPAIRPYQRELPEISDRVRQQALLTEKSIRQRASSQQ
jgi:HlyD family secretion protein/HEAT repeat